MRGHIVKRGPRYYAVVYEGVNLAKEKLQDVPGEVLYFPTKPVLKEVMAAVERVAI